MPFEVIDDPLIVRVSKLDIWFGTVDPEPLLGGITNKNFVVRDRGRRYVVRTGGDILAHGVVRANELAATRAAHAAGISPAVIHAEPGIMVIEFIEGRTFQPEDVRNPANLERLVDLIRRCHRDVALHLRGPAPMFWPFHVIRDYGHTLREGGSPHAGLLPDLLARAERLEKAVGQIDVVFGHNDLLAANILDDGARLWLLDWEYAGFNSPLFDLGGLASNSEMPADLSEALLASYFGRPIDALLRRQAAAMTAASLLRETLWAMVSEIHSSVDFDYAAYTAENLARFETSYNHYETLESP
ncbi:MAG: phosphotransferase [Hyphomicrobium zavarzinii]|uniref:phosphotransferase n=1 Tax=Hyphomicrobium zavarzinii TaxID=48292 RepID=UPI001A540344|nr:phosphotransferase [Hyphomicrobium zavarzinii]MBL8847516.1 phosphotransferase [Hyphomicrobium zavarzinii]